jgi:hypothetical protein
LGDPRVDILMCRLRGAITENNLEKIKEIQTEAKKILKEVET